MGLFLISWDVLYIPFEACESTLPTLPGEVEFPKLRLDIDMTGVDSI